MIDFYNDVNIKVFKSMGKKLSYLAGSENSLLKLQCQTGMFKTK